MDRRIEKKRWSTARVVVLLGSVAAAGLTYAVVERSSVSTLTVAPQRLTTAAVTAGEFVEYYPFDGTVEPLTTVYLDIEEGGRVEEIFVEGGQHIEKGTMILRFSNATLQRNSIDTEARLVENLNQLRNTQFSLAQNALLLREKLLDLDHQINELEKTHARYETMDTTSGTAGVIPREVIERNRDELDYLKAKRELLRERIEQEEILSRRQLEQAELSIERLSLALELLHRTIESLVVRAPISGFLSSIDAQVGENITRGQRIGQIDLLDRYKISVRIDQYYISRVQVGMTGRFQLDGRTHPVVVRKIYPEVVNDVFRVDVDFVDGPRPGLRRGQRLTVELSFSEPTTSLMIAKGGFFQSTGGRWVYLVAPDGLSAKRTPVRLGRQNPRYIEVLEGLKEGDWIVSSSYDAFNGVDELRFDTPIELVH